MTPPPAVALAGVEMAYGAHPVLHGVTLDVADGERVALLGASGCGKTTLLRLVAGLEAPDAGTIHLGGEFVADARRCAPPETRHVGLVFQEYALFPHLDAHANVAFGLPRRARRSERPRLDALLDQVGLQGLGHRYPHELSGGQRQRLALARALAPAPRVLLLDEPFSNLDAQLRASTRREVARVLDAVRTTAILVTHDREEALAFADRIALLEGGHVLQVGTPRELYEAPASLVVARFVGDADAIDGRARGGRVDTAFGALPGVGPEGEVEVLLRPEQLRPSDEGVAALVEAVEYAGPVVRVTLAAEGVATRLRTALPALGAPRVGDRLRLRVEGPVRWFARA